MEFDYVIVGAGSAGCALASRLADRSTATVALLEAGPRDRNPWIHIPVGYYRTKTNPKLTWGFRTEPELQLNQRQINWPRGKVLGGSSSINGLLYIRGHPLDYDEWAQLGAPGWSWAQMLPIFRRMEDQERGADAWHGQGGALGVADLRPKHPLMDAYIKAAARCGLAPNDDFNGPSMDGIGYFQLTLRNGWRCSAATAYRINGKRRGNLAIMTDHQVERVLFSEGCATGVRLLKDRSVVRARREVVLCAGAIGSPQLLELSGIGNPEILKANNIGVIFANRSVGENLQDHFQAKLVFKVAKPVTINDVLNNPLRKALVASEFALRRTGLMTVGAAQVCGFARLMPNVNRPDMQIHAMPASSDDPKRGMDPFSGFTSSVSQLRPKSRGSVHIQSPDARDAPTIRANYLAEETDREFMISSVRFARKIAQQPELANYISEEHRPGEAAETEDEILDFIRTNGSTNYHPAGTCQIGPTGKGVVAPDLRVHGIEGLRVADASIMPTIISGNTNAPSIAIGERLADILTEAPSTRS